MKTNTLIIGMLALAFSFSTCQNKSAKTEDQSSMDMSSDSSEMNMDSTSMASGMMGAMDKMMDNMHKIEKKGNTDYDLAATMKAHHQGAIDMAQTELKSGSDSQLKMMAQKIIDIQSNENKDLDKLLDKYKDASKNYDPENADTGLGKAMTDNMMSMMDMPKTEGASTDHDFAMMMSKHHKEGVKMGNTILRFAKDPMFKSMAQKIIIDQSNEIKELEKWLTENK